MSALGYEAEASRADEIASEHCEAKAAFMAASEGASRAQFVLEAASARYKTAREALITARAERTVAQLRAEHDALVAGEGAR